jgi:tRNA (guanine-N7-)-methyltransferase
LNRGDVILRPTPECLISNERPGAPRLIEIGFGNGDFLVHLAHKRRDALIYGIEMSHMCLEKALSKIRRLELDNVRLLCGDARFLLRECFPDNSAERIYMSFPCPWPKERHARRRVTSKGFSGTLASILKIGGVFEMATDEGWYADEVEEILGAHEALKLVGRRLNFRREITTKYERKWLEQGKDIHLLYIEKTAPWEEPRMVEGSLEDMHVRIAPAVPVSLEKLNSVVTGVTASAIGRHNVDSHWAFRGGFRAEDGTLLEETICTDSGYEQKFYIKIVNKPECTLVKLDGVFIPYLTPSVRMALEDLADRIKSR